MSHIARSASHIGQEKYGAPKTAEQEREYRNAHSSNHTAASVGHLPQTPPDGLPPSSPVRTHVDATVTVYLPSISYHSDTSEWIRRVASEEDVSIMCSSSGKEKEQMSSNLTCMISGAAKDVVTARRRLLERIVFLETTETMTINETSSGNGLDHGAETVESLAKKCGVTVTGNSTDHKTGRKHFNVSGHFANIDNFKFSFLDKTNTSLTNQYFHIPSHLHPIIAGREGEDLSHIAESNRVEIHFSSPLSALFSNINGTHPNVMVSGSSASVEGVKALLLKNAAMASTRLVHAPITCLPRKLDWLLCRRRAAVIDIMTQNAVFLEFPPLGSGSPVLQVVGIDEVYVRRAVRMVMKMTEEYYVACMVLADSSDSVFACHSPDTCPNLLSHTTGGGTSTSTSTTTSSGGSHSRSTHSHSCTLAAIADKTNTEIVLKANFVEMYGTAEHLKRAFRGVAEVTRIYIHDTKFQIELALSHLDFINGKKSGKLNRIARETGCKVAIQERYNGCNMLIEVFHADLRGVSEGVELLEAELPAELSFHIPDHLHKRIIGPGGSNVQRIMKQYGVFIKFASGREYAQLGGFARLDHNVVARTPAKNRAQLEGTRRAVEAECGEVQAPRLSSTPAQRSEHTMTGNAIGQDIQQRAWRPPVQNPGQRRMSARSTPDLLCSIESFGAPSRASLEYLNGEMRASVVRIPPPALPSHGNGQSHVLVGAVHPTGERVPTDKFSGFGISKSAPDFWFEQALLPPLANMAPPAHNAIPPRLRLDSFRFTPHPTPHSPALDMTSLLSPESEIASRRTLGVVEQVLGPARDKNVESFLEGIGMAKLAGVFEKCEVDYDALKKLDENDLETLGITDIADRRVIAQGIKKLKRTKSARVADQ
ncbi:hypothetical protein M427DRAFT_33335 [Gonapodya prolifera JEL478]|uniref:SAM domain-containing protein n=1 Tax=Gonapodya prolifera (strain JEL478) TaxID=1344416 RepID=A0A139ABM7_GONPJ|nr:hypothetical protein M427DRAFT_33335 [Gonapodya prolifera JEL478]|eukprot:KXS14128.1 hypothetical protein M427DRAFT_33335 [Gonapodya prolifera JEL478]